MGESLSQTALWHTARLAVGATDYDRQIVQDAFPNLPLNGSHASNRETFRTYLQDHPELTSRIYSLDPSVPLSEFPTDLATGPTVPPLPVAAQLPLDLAVDASPWLDSYIGFSRRWSPRAYDGFHEACGIWVLSTVAARRVALPLGRMRYTSLFMLLAARTSLFAKTTTAGIGIETLKTAGLDWLLAADASSPQKFIQDLTTRLPDDFDRLPESRQNRIRKRLAFAGQRGWFYDEFGQKVHAMHRRDGPMAEFRGIIRRFDDCADDYEYGTIGRGTDYVKAPYLALLGNITPADLRPFAKRGAALWNDGFWARFAFIAPPTLERNHSRFPHGERVIPSFLFQPLKEWHQRLGVPSVEFKGDNDKASSKQIERTDLAPTVCTLGDGVFDAFYAYHDGLSDIFAESDNTDLDGNYARFAEKALRVAMLLASLENNGRIEMRHWARGQEITERWRAGLHALYEQVNEPEPSEDELMEEKVLQVITRHGKQTPAQVARYVRGLSSNEAEPFLRGLARAGVLTTEDTTRTTYFDFPKD